MEEGVWGPFVSQRSYISVLGVNMCTLRIDGCYDGKASLLVSTCVGFNSKEVWVVVYTCIWVKFVGFDHLVVGFNLEDLVLGV